MIRPNNTDFDNVLATDGKRGGFIEVLCSDHMNKGYYGVKFIK